VDAFAGSVVPVSRLQAWIAQNIYLSLKSVSFSKDDENLVPEAGSCANCPKRTGYNRLLFSEVREDSDSCADAACFNRKLDEHIAQRISKTPNLVQISENYNTTGETPNIIASKSYNTQSDYRFDMKTFMELRNAQSITFAYDGLNPKADPNYYARHTVIKAQVELQQKASPRRTDNSRPEDGARGTP